jgi:hypothetical protein
MPTPMNIYRLEDLSVNYFVKGLFASSSFITVVDDFPKEILRVPTISVEAGKMSEERFELGNRDSGLRVRRWFIDVFAATKSQRDDFSYKILEETDNGINVYDYNEGFPPGASPSIVNHLDVITKIYEPIDVIPTVNEKLYYRGQVILITKNDKV